jgi:hypothetical protein
MIRRDTRVNASSYLFQTCFITREISEPPRFAGKRACQTLAEHVTLPAKSVNRRDSRVSELKVTLSRKKMIQQCKGLTGKDPASP